MPGCAGPPPPVAFLTPPVAFAQGSRVLRGPLPGPICCLPTPSPSLLRAGTLALAPATVNPPALFNIQSWHCYNPGSRMCRASPTCCILDAPCGFCSRQLCVVWSTAGPHFVACLTPFQPTNDWDAVGTHSNLSCVMPRAHSPLFCGSASWRLTLVTQTQSASHTPGWMEGGGPAHPATRNVAVPTLYVEKGEGCYCCGSKSKIARP